MQVSYYYLTHSRSIWWTASSIWKSSWPTAAPSCRPPSSSLVTASDSLISSPRTWRQADGSGNRGAVASARSWPMTSRWRRKSATKRYPISRTGDVYYVFYLLHPVNPIFNDMYARTIKLSKESQFSQVWRFPYFLLCRRPHDPWWFFHELTL